MFMREAACVGRYDTNRRRAIGIDIRVDGGCQDEVQKDLKCGSFADPDDRDQSCHSSATQRGNESYIITCFDSTELRH